MLSKWFTLSLVILASVVGGLACIQLFFHQDDLGKIFGTPPRQAGDVLYENFDGTAGELQRGGVEQVEYGVYRKKPC